MGSVIKPNVPRIPDYGTQRPTRSRIRTLVLSTVILLAVVVSARFGRPIRSHVALLMSQWRCMRYVDTRHAIPVFGNNLIGEYRQRVGFLEHSTTTPERPGAFPRGPFAPILTDKWETLVLENPDIRVYGRDDASYGGRMQAGRIPNCWQEFATRAKINGVFQRLPSGEEANRGIIFLGVLCPSGGQPRLVAASACTVLSGWGRGGTYLGLGFQIDVVTPASLFKTTTQAQTVLRHDGTSPHLLPIYSSPDVTIYPGQILPNDATTFRAKVTIGSRDADNNPINSEDGWLVGTLVDAQTLRLTLQDFGDPASAPTTRSVE
jgi:hypothetical protein